MTQWIPWLALTPLALLGACGGGTDEPVHAPVSSTSRAGIQAVATEAGGLVNGDFETPVLPAGTYVYQPKSVNGWTFSASAVLTATESAFSLQAPVFGSSKQMVALQDYGKIQQTLEVRPGDELWFRAIQRQNTANIYSSVVAVLLDGVEQAFDDDLAVGPPTSVVPSFVGWNLYRVKLNPSAPGTHQLTIRGISGGDVTTLLDDVRLVRGVVPTMVPMAGGSFESPSMGVAGYAYRPDGTGWTMAGGAAVSADHSAFSINPLYRGDSWEGDRVAPTAKAGSQVAVLQMNASLSRKMSLQPGDVLQFSVTPRQAASDFYIDPVTAHAISNDQILRVFVNGEPMQSAVLSRTWNMSFGAWQTWSVPLTAVTEAGDYEVELRTEMSEPYADESLFIDDVQIRRAVIQP